MQKLFFFFVALTMKGWSLLPPETCLMSAATAILSRAMCRTEDFRDGKAIGMELSLRIRAATAVGVDCW